MTTEDFISVITERISREFSPQKIILFGSFAKGMGGEESDIDLLVVFPAVADQRGMAVEIRKRLSDLPVSKDIFVATPEEINRRKANIGDFIGSALEEGRVLYEQVG